MRKEVEIMKKFNIRVFRKCKDCNKVYDNTKFTKSKKCQYGITHRCLKCENDKFKKNKKEFYDKNKDILARKAKEKYKLKSNTKEFKNKCKKANRKYYKKNKHIINKKTSNYKKNNPDKHAFHESIRRCKKLKATPKWSDLDKIKVLYEKAKWLGSLTGLKYHVDHVIPLQGNNICGLHIWENLQILESSLNCSKNNNWEV